ncbi:pyridoxal phosphate-dependent aminotransferase [Bacteroidales bacterium OttesenSCG-928-I21]|nr:pyridoxal phosphate-dependent aminotransferase [Bacteroidales bacterium OttesenSCG-928-I21]
MENLSERIKNMANSATLAMTQKSRDLQSQGINVINLSIGEPDFATPDYVKEAAKKAIDDNYTHYPPVPGYGSLQNAISQKFKRENNLDFEPNQIVVSNGAKHSIANVILSIIGPGDEVIVPAPYWVSYPDLIILAEGKPVFVECEIEQNFKMTAKQLENAITSKTKAIIFSSPSNPTGNLYSKQELKELADVLSKKENEKIIIISDEIYEHINFVGKHESIAQFNEIKDRVVVVNGVSKGYAMTGWRIGYIGAPLWLAKAVTKLQGQFTSGACTIAQKASEAALNGGMEVVNQMTGVFKKRRDLVYDLLKEIPGLKINLPDGAFYFFPDVSSFFGKSYENYNIKTSSDLALFLLDKAHVATVGGDAFGAPKCLRLSYATSEDLLKKAVADIKEALTLLK